MAQHRCSIDGCEKLNFCRTWCAMHYKRWQKYGDTSVRIRPEYGLRCTVEGCDEPHCSRGMCTSHYARWRRYGTPYAGGPSKQRRAGLVCSVDDCNRPVYGRGWCSHHWQRWRRTGDPLGVGTGRGILHEARLQRAFWERIERCGPVSEYAPHLGPCWLWTGRLHEGYGIRSGKRAHVIAYQLLVGPVPEDQVLDHLCRVRHCVNPGHLEPVTRRENALRGTGISAINARKTHCLRGHPLSGDNLYVNPKKGTRSCRICIALRRREGP